MSVLNAPPKNRLVNELLEAINKLKDTPPLIEVKAPALVIGDLHGDCSSLIKALELLPEYCSDCRSIIFLGDCIDRGPNGLCVINTIADLYLNNSNLEVVLLRGNHETRLLSSTYGFLDEVRQKYSTGWKEVLTHP